MRRAWCAIVGAMHGEKQQFERMQTIQDFKQAKTQILVATDVAARGLDIKGLKTVVNFDVAKNIDAHVHRIGRTGRAGKDGAAYTLLTKKQHGYVLSFP
jgi:ATP-dependent RNA helicase DDX42